MKRAVPLLLTPIVACAALVGCSSTTNGSPGSHTSAATSTATTSAATTPATTPSTGSSQTTTSAAPTTSATSSHPSVPLCTSDIRVINGTGQGAAGTLAQVLIFNNVSTTVTCEIIGYPGVDAVTSTGATVVHFTRTLRGMAGGEPPGVTAPQPVILAPGQSASALIEASDVPQGGISNCGDYALMITVPNQYVAVGSGTLKMPRCDAQVHPVVPGTGGGMS